MNRIYIVLFCIIYHSGISHQDSELVGDSNDNENKKMSNRDSEPDEAGENDDLIKKLNQQNSGTAEDNNDGDVEKVINRDSEAATDDKNNHDIVNDATEKTITLTQKYVEENEELENNEEPENNVEAENKEESENNVEAENNEEPENNEADENHQFNTKVSEDNLKLVHPRLENKDEEMEIEREAGDAADFFGTNQHYNIPVNYQDFGRRFVLTYPYVEKKKKIADDAAESELDNTVKQHLESKAKKELIPVKAPPEFVLQIAKQSALLEASKPKNPANDIIQKDILRTGQYWDDVWTEEVDAGKILRSTKKQNKLDSLTVKISPGSKLHTLISMLKQRSPRFLYVINKNTERYFHCFISRYLQFVAIIDV